MVSSATKETQVMVYTWCSLECLESCFQKLIRVVLIPMPILNSKYEKLNYLFKTLTREFSSRIEDVKKDE